MKNFLQIFFLVIILFFSCSITDQGIFSSIEHETKNVNTGLPDYLTVTNLGVLGLNVYAGSSTIYYKSTAAVEQFTNLDQWLSMGIPSGYPSNNTYCISMTMDTSNIYALFMNDITGVREIFYSPGSGTAWQKCTINGLSGPNLFLDEIQMVNGLLFVKFRFNATGISTDATGVYIRGLASSTPGSVLNFSANYMPSSAANINTSYLTSIAYLNNGGNKYYFSDGKNLYGGTGAGAVNIISTNINLDSDEYIQTVASIANGSTTFLLLGTNKGKIIYSTDGSSYNYITVTNNGGNLNIQYFGSYTYSATPNYVLIIGTQTTGFFELDYTNATSIGTFPSGGELAYPMIAASQSNYSSQVLHYSPVYSSCMLSTYPSTLILLIGTYSQGVWKNYDTSGNNNWNRE